MLRKKNTPPPVEVRPAERVTSVLGPGINWHGNLRGSGGIRIEGAFDGEIGIRGLVVIGETGRVTCEKLQANTVIVAGAMHGNIIAEKLEIRGTGRVWGDVIVGAFATEEGAFLRGKVQMEEHVELSLEEETAEAEAQPESDSSKPLSNSADAANGSSPVDPA